MMTAPVTPSTTATRATGTKSLDLARIDKTAKDFEAVFLSEMFKPMFDTVKTDPVFGGGDGEDSFKSLLIDQYGKAMQAAGGIGIADAVRAQMIRLQEAH